MRHGRTKLGQSGGASAQWKYDIKPIDLQCISSAKDSEPRKYKPTGCIACLSIGQNANRVRANSGRFNWKAIVYMMLKQTPLLQAHNTFVPAHRVPTSNGHAYKIELCPRIWEQLSEDFRVMGDRREQIAVF